MRRSLALIVALAGIGGCAEKLPEGWAALRGHRSDNAVELLWELKAWPRGVTGFTVRWRAGQGEGEWQPLSPRPVEPGIGRAKNLENVEPDARRREQLQADLARRLETGEAQEVARDDFIEAVRDEPDKLEALKREIRTDPTRALFIGMGAIDRTVRSDVPREYGLFPVRSDGEVDADPVATFMAHVFDPGDGRLKVRELAVEPRGRGAFVSWRIETSTLNTYGIGSFNVFRGSELLTRAPLGSARMEDGWSHFAWLDRTADPSQSSMYAIEPVSVFGRPLPVRTEFAFSPDSPGAFRPSNVGVSRVADGVSIDWQVNSGRERAIAGFVVQRVALPDGATVQISPILPATARSFVDTGARAGASYLYLVASDARGARHTSAPVIFDNTDRTPPPAPESLRASVLKVSGRSYIQLRWTPAVPEAGVEGYALFADKVTEDRLSRQASIPLIRAAEYELEVAPLQTRTYTIGVAAVRQGTVGPMSKVSIEVPGAMEKRR